MTTFKEVPVGAEFRVQNSGLTYQKTLGTVEALHTHKYNATTNATIPGGANPPFALVGRKHQEGTAWYCMFPDDEAVELAP